MAQTGFNGPPPLTDDDQFDLDLKEALGETPSLNDLGSTVQGSSIMSDGGTGGGVGGGGYDIGSGGGGYGISAGGGYGIEASPQHLVSTQEIHSSPTNTASIPRSQSVPPATSNIPLSSPDRNGQNYQKPRSTAASLYPVANKMESIKAWSMNTYKCTRQILGERFGKASRTVDVELEAQIEALRDTQNRYANILRLSRALTSHFHNVVQTQRALGETFADLSQKNPELNEEFSYNSETQKAVCKHGDTLLGALNFFTSTVNTLCNKTMEDTLMTIKLYENARVEYDAYRTDIEAASGAQRDPMKQDEAQRKFAEHKAKYDKLRADVSIKLKFLEENKVKVMHKQLLLFNNAIAAYFSGNHTSLEATLKQFNIRLKTPNSDKPSWLEQ